MTVLLTALALLAFAANSILCRMALGDGSIDPARFSLVRLSSGALLLVLLALARARGPRGALRGGWPSAAMLGVYALAFSFAYVDLGAGTGALILFAAVQATMLARAIHAGERPHPLEWAGLLLAIGGLFWLVSPGLSAPPLGGSILMGGAGIAWGIYSLRGRGEADPLAATAGNFLRAAPLALLALPAAAGGPGTSSRGVLLAVASGAITSGLGYVAWYAALRGLNATRAAMVQLLVPVLAALGGVILLGETITLRLVLSGVLIFGGVGLAMTARRGELVSRKLEG